MQFLILPGINNSGPDHWQSLWEKSSLHYSRVIQDDWDNPICAEWINRLEETVHASGPNTILIAHSLSCLLVAHWACITKLSILGALLVAVPDPNSAEFPSLALSFANPPQEPFNFKSLLVASTNDPYSSVEYTHRCANAWGSDFVTIGDAGHINTASGLGAWPVGQELLQKLIKAIVGAEDFQPLQQPHKTSKNRY